MKERPELRFDDVVVMAAELALEEAEVDVEVIVEERLNPGEEDVGREGSAEGWEDGRRELRFDLVVGGGTEEGHPFTPSLNEFDLALLVNLFGLERNHIVEPASASETDTTPAPATSGVPVRWCLWTASAEDLPCESRRPGYGDFLLNLFEPLLLPDVDEGTPSVTRVECMAVECECAFPVLAALLLRFFPNNRNPLLNLSFPLDFRSQVDSVPKGAASRSVSPGYLEEVEGSWGMEK